MDPLERLRARVMRRVYLMYYGRQICKPIPRIMIIGVLVLAVVGSVSVVNVAINLLNTSSLYGLGMFLVSAFANADRTVQLLTFAIAAMLGWFVVDTVKNLRVVSFSEAVH